MMEIGLWLYVFFIAWYGQSTASFVEEEIFDGIFHKYNKNVRPAADYNQTVVVKHGLHLIKILECDGKTFKAETWLPISWPDPRLVWSVETYKLKSLVVPANLVWIPDIVLLNNPSSLPVYNPRAIITHNGEVSWFPATTVVTNCEPSSQASDTISCFLKFGSWSYDGNQLDLETMYESVDTGDYVQNQQWEFRNASTVKNVKKYPGWPVPYIDITYNITLKRRNPIVSASSVEVAQNQTSVHYQDIRNQNETLLIEVIDAKSQLQDSKESTSDSEEDSTEVKSKEDSSSDDR